MILRNLFNLSISIAISTRILHSGRSTTELCRGGGLIVFFCENCLSTIVLFAIGNIAIWGDNDPQPLGSVPVLQLDTLHEYTTSSQVNWCLPCRNAGKFGNTIFTNKACIKNPLSARMRLPAFKKIAAYSSSNANVERKKILISENSILQS